MLVRLLGRPIWRRLIHGGAYTRCRKIFGEEKIQNVQFLAEAARVVVSLTTFSIVPTYAGKTYDQFLH